MAFQKLSSKPNIVLLITDQTRTPGMHWPAGFVETHLPSFSRLRRCGMTFRRAHIAASMCSPSRATMFTGAYENVNGCQTVVSEVEGEQLRPASELPNLATMLKSAGYEVVYKGKWDMTQPWEQIQEDTGQVDQLPRLMEETYGFSGWNPPDSGIELGFPINKTLSAYTLSTLGGGKPGNDPRYIRGEDPATVCRSVNDRGTGCQTPGVGESILDYLKRIGQTPANQRNPFFLVVSLTNPHDIGFYPNGYDYPAVGYPKSVDLGVKLPDNFNDSLTTKPAIQTRYRQVVETAEFTPEQLIGYVNFYAFLYEVVDKSVMTVLDALDANGLTNDTIIIRTADHGELGLSHGLTEKCYTAYQEVVNVPLIFSNPILFPEPQQTDALWSHIDLTATIAGLTGAQRIGVGIDQSEVLKNPAATLRDSAVYAMDDALGTTNIPLTTPASHNRALITDRYTYAVYFTASYAGTEGNSSLSANSPYQLELYDKQADSGELNNLLWKPAPSIEPLWRSLHEKLTASMKAMGSMPPGWPETLSDLKAGVQW